MAAYKVVHAVCLLHCGVQVMDTRHITLNKWQLLLEEWVLSVASRVRHLPPKSPHKNQGQGNGKFTGEDLAFTIVSPVIVHLRVCKSSMMISPAKGQKSLDILHSTGRKRRRGREEEKKRQRERKREWMKLSLRNKDTLAQNLSQK